MGVVSRRWMWVESIGVASGCGCKEVYNYIDFLILFIPAFLVFVIFCSSILTFVHLKKLMFSYIIASEVSFLWSVISAKKGGCVEGAVFPEDGNLEGVFFRGWWRRGWYFSGGCYFCIGQYFSRGRWRRGRVFFSEGAIFLEGGSLEGAIFPESAILSSGR